MIRFCPLSVTLPTGPMQRKQAWVKCAGFHVFHTAHFDNIMVAISPHSSITQETHVCMRLYEPNSGATLSQLDCTVQPTGPSPMVFQTRDFNPLEISTANGTDGNEMPDLIFLEVQIKSEDDDDLCHLMIEEVVVAWT